VSVEGGAEKVRGGPANFEVRPAREEDLPAINDLYNHYIVNTAITFDIEPWSLEQRRELRGDGAASGARGGGGRAGGRVCVERAVPSEGGV